METIVPGVVLKQKVGIAPRKIKNKEKRRGPKVQKLEMFIIEGYSEDKAMELAGYSEWTRKTKKAKVLRYVNWDEIRLALKPRSIHANHMAIDVAMRQMEHGDSKQQGWGAKLALDNAKIHLADDKSPTNIVFSFQTIQGENVQLNVDKASKDAPGQEIIDAEVGEDE